MITDKPMILQHIKELVKKKKNDKKGKKEIFVLCSNY